MTSRRNLLAAPALAALFETACRKQEPRAAGPDSTEEFASRVMDDIAAAALAPLSYLGDKLGLFRALAAGPATPIELAMKTGLHERYTRAWLEAMTVAGYVDQPAGGGKFVLPPERAAVLTDEESPFFLGGVFEGLAPLAAITPKIEEAFRTGKGTQYSDYSHEFFESQARSSATDFQHRLVQEWMPSIPQAVERLTAGGSAADVGCGGGVASIVLAKAYPRSRFWGFD